MSQQRLIITPDQCQAQTLVLTSQQQHYLRHVLRLHPGDRFLALDGQGQQWLAELAEHATVATLVEEIRRATPVDSACPIILLAALPKGNGFDEVVRQTTELGVTCLQPVLTERTLANPSAHKQERWQRIAKEATEQSERLTLPEICTPLAWEQALAALPKAGDRYLCVTRDPAPHLLTCLHQASWQGITLAIGPEGGWTAGEVAAAKTAQFQPVSLGTSILRAVTAPIVALALVQGALATRA